MVLMGFACGRCSFAERVDGDVYLFREMFTDMHGEMFENMSTKLLRELFGKPFGQMPRQTFEEMFK